MKLITDISNIDLKEVERFVYNHSSGNFFQSIKAFKFFQSVDYFDPILITAWNGSEIVGSLLGVIIGDGRGVKKYFSRRCIVWGGPLVKNDSPDLWALIVEKLSMHSSSQAIYTEYRNLREISDKKKIFKKAGYQFNAHLNYLLYISSYHNARVSLSKSKKRQINKSIGRGAIIIQAESVEQVKCFYEILYSLYKEKVKKPLPAYGFFKKFFQDKELGKYLLVKYKGQIIGGVMCPVYKDTIYEWFVCGLDGKQKGIYPSVLATWAPIQYAANNGLRYFDFMGAGKPNQDYGVREFKSKFGGDLIAPGRFIRIEKRIHYAIGKLGLALLKLRN